MSYEERMALIEEMDNWYRMECVKDMLAQL